MGGWEDPLILVQAWHRDLKSEAMALYNWVSYQINQRHMQITAAMQLPQFAPGGKCGRFYRQYRTDLWDEDLKAHYITARYAGKIIDYSNLQAEFIAG